MSKQFVLHVRNAYDHLDAAKAALGASNYEEVIVSLRCVLAEIHCARQRPVVGAVEWTMLDSIEKAALEGQVLILNAMVRGGDGS